MNTPLGLEPKVLHNVLVEDVGFLASLLAALVATYRRHLAFLARSVKLLTLQIPDKRGVGSPG